MKSSWRRAQWFAIVMAVLMGLSQLLEIVEKSENGLLFKGYLFSAVMTVVISYFFVLLVGRTM